MIPMKVLVPGILLVGLSLARVPVSAQSATFTCEIEITRISNLRDRVFYDKRAITPGSTPKGVLYEGQLGTLTLGSSVYGTQVEWSKGPFKDRSGAYYRGDYIKTYGEDAALALGYDLTCTR